MGNPNPCSLLYCPVPYQVDGAPVLCIAAAAASPYGRVCFIFNDVCFSLCDSCCCFCPSTSASPRVSCVVLAPPAGHRNACFFELYVAALFFCFVLFCLVLFFLVLRLVLSCRPSVGPSPRDIIGLIPPANSNLFPPGLACALRACMKFLFRFSFLSFLCLFLFCPFLPFFTRLCITVLSSPLVPVYACTTAMFLAYSRSK